MQKSDRELALQASIFDLDDGTKAAEMDQPAAETCRRELP